MVCLRTQQTPTKLHQQICQDLPPSHAPPVGNLLPSPKEPELVAEPEEQTTPFDEFGDIESLRERANAGEDEAKNQLTALAEKYGVAQEVHTANSWDDAVDLIVKASGTTSVSDEESGEPTPDAEDEPGDRIPVIGEVWRWRFKDGKSGKPTSKPMLIQITGYSIKDGKAAGLQMNKEKTARKNMPIDELEPASV